jgi:hypothetical protein
MQFLLLPIVWLASIFPIQLAFKEREGSFKMRQIPQPMDAEAVPEGVFWRLRECCCGSLRGGVFCGSINKFNKCYLLN